MESVASLTIGFSIRRMIQDQSFAAVLWDIHEKVKKEGYVQVSSAGKFFPQPRYLHSLL